ncbi:hypothetical protein TUM19329_14770 [Legionella antarctica]|uniref:Uncharacterized protein n=1 Tax=Legionella antarctica TaxID=2708020 RepID=A0A6F8T573_9GAMM|nr:hypothetical protein [Legionella antarctica]BCA95116.1 hypothetical protein TUM19329_14770 [Legionella antarctica]
MKNVQEVTIGAVIKAIKNNFISAHEVARVEKQSGIEYPGHSGYNCSERADLKTILERLGGPHIKAVDAVNNGHDSNKTPLHPFAKEALIQQAKHNQENGLSPFLPHKDSRSQESLNLDFGHFPKPAMR